MLDDGQALQQPPLGSRERRDHEPLAGPRIAAAGEMLRRKPLFRDVELGPAVPVVADGEGERLAAGKAESTVESRVERSRPSRVGAIADGDLEHHLALLRSVVDEHDVVGAGLARTGAEGVRAEERDRRRRVARPDQVPREPECARDHASDVDGHLEDDRTSHLHKI